MNFVDEGSRIATSHIFYTISHALEGQHSAGVMLYLAEILVSSNIIYLDPSYVSVCSSVGHLTQHSDANAYTFSLNTFSDAVMRFLQILVAHESFIPTLLCKGTPR